MQEFWEDNDSTEWQRINWQTDNIGSESGLPWLELRLPWPIPFHEMLAEAKNIRHLMVPHREHESYPHKGWKSICLHGLSAQRTLCHSDYGYGDDCEAPYDWTEISKLCPVATGFFRDIFSYARYLRIRFMLLEAGGYIAPLS